MERDGPLLDRLAVGVEEVDLGGRTLGRRAEGLGWGDQADDPALAVEADGLEGQPLLALHVDGRDHLVRGLELLGRVRRLDRGQRHGVGRNRVTGGEQERGGPQTEQFHIWGSGTETKSSADR